jgi:hypothetical protein
MTVDELLGRISSLELTEWMALAKIEAEDARLRELAKERRASGHNR